MSVIMKNYTKLPAFLAVVMSISLCSSSLDAQQITFPRLGGEMRLASNGGTTTASIWVNAVNGADWLFGPATLKFTYDRSALTYPAVPSPGTDYNFQNLTPPFYNSSTVTRPQESEVSVNIVIGETLGDFAVPITASAVHIADIIFTNGAQPVQALSAADFTWTLCEHSGLMPGGVSDLEFIGPDDPVDCEEMSNATLPVELASFDVNTTDRSATISWATASEENNAGFTVEYSRDAVEFTEAGFVEGNGTTVEEQNYSYTIDHLLPGKYSFRLKQVDYDGQFEYSDIVEGNVSIPGEFMLDNAYPNPFNPQTTINFAVAEEQEVRFDLYDTTGRMVKTLFHGTVESNEAETVRVDGSDLTSGVYIGVLVGKTFKASQRLVLIK